MPSTLEQSELGKKSLYKSHYDASLLFPLARLLKRQELGLSATDALPFHGIDRWHHYEVSWLNDKGKPVVAQADIRYSCTSPHIIESKSMKLYFNSLNNSHFHDASQVKALVEQDLSLAVGDNVSVHFSHLQHNDSTQHMTHFKGICLDNLDIDCDTYMIHPEFLTTETTWIEQESLYSDLLKSNCLVTHQPDWGSVCITYSGNKINHAGLLKYIVSFRNHPEFHEQCIERIFMDILRRCKPMYLSVDGRYTRRGGLDINPYRSSLAWPNHASDHKRLCRQ